jgi:hypothetical protein
MHTQSKNIERFSLPKTLIVEGSEDHKFALEFLRHLKINDKIYVHPVGGNSGLTNKTNDSLMLSAETPQFKRSVKHLAILFDGDGDKEKAFDRIKKEILKINSDFEELNFLTSPNLNYIDNDLIMPGHKGFEIPTFIFLFEKNLEHTFLQSLSEEEQKIIEKCIPEFFKCANVEISDKRSVHAFLSVKETKNGFARDIGFAASQEAIDFDHTSFSDLKNFLLDFSKL